MSSRLFAAAFVLHIFSSPALSHFRFASNLSKVSLTIALPVFVCLFSCLVLLCVFFKHCIELFTDLNKLLFRTGHGPDSVLFSSCIISTFCYFILSRCYFIVTGDADSVIHLLLFLIYRNSRPRGVDSVRIQRTEKDGGCTFYHDTLRT